MNYYANCSNWKVFNVTTMPTFSQKQRCLAAKSMKVVKKEHRFAKVRKVVMVNPGLVGIRDLLLKHAMGKIFVEYLFT